MQRWEYRVLTVHKRQAEEVEAFAARMNKLGAEGWELVAYGELHLTEGLIRKGTTLFFKRPIE